MDVESLVHRLLAEPAWRDRSRVVRKITGREAAYGCPSEPLPDSLREGLAARGIGDLYSHQVAMLESARQGESAVVVTGTASGKSLCYHLPILESCLADPESRALYLFPTKALARDQLGTLQGLLASQPTLAGQVRAEVFDGDTPVAQRREVRGRVHLVLSNPDMLHASILPQHAKWARFFSTLRYVVIDEVHTYRGIFGSHVANVLRRLRRVCEHYGSRPRFLAASATIGNPRELAEQLVDEPMTLVDENGAPRGPRYTVLWNPPEIGEGSLARKSSAEEAVGILSYLLREGSRSITFTRTRVSAELIYRSLVSELSTSAPRAAKWVKPYRGGYLPNERRKIEKDLFENKLRAIISTNALELGIDVGSLDAAVLVGYPGTIASCWQQMGRAGRRLDPSLAILVASADPIDQFLVRHPDYFFSQSAEKGSLDAANPYIVARHLKCAAFELPLVSGELSSFGPAAEPIAGHLADLGDITETAGEYYWARPDNPAVGVSLRHMSDNTFSIIEQTSKGNQVIANVDAISAPELVYPEAIYLHAGETLFVRSLDLVGKVAYVDRVDSDYYTQAILESRIALKERRDRADFRDGSIGFGTVDVAWKTVAFKKIKFETRENIGFGPVDIPEQILPTTALWLVLGPETARWLKSQGYRPSESMMGLRNLMVSALPLVSMADPRDIGGVLDSSNLGSSAVFVYDRYPQGLGFAERGYLEIEELVRRCYDMVADCPCESGCPSCVGLPNFRPAIHSDPDLTRGQPIPNKQATLALLARWSAQSEAETSLAG